MLLNDEDSPLLRPWLIERLQGISDADADVLADYVLALVKTDDPEYEARKSCADNLEDFLGERKDSPKE